MVQSNQINRYGSFDGLRGYAAIGILLMHYLANMPNGCISSLVVSCPFLYGRLIPYFTMFVYMFFIVSAFSMCCGYFEKFRMRTIDGVAVSGFDVNKFYSRRYARVWPFFALLVCVDVLFNPSIETIYQAFADLTLAFNLLPNPDISVIGVGWFLGLVFLFYIIFPWFVYLLQTPKRAWFALTIAVVFHFVLVRYFLTNEFCTISQINNFRHNIVFSFPFFMVGGLLYLYRDFFKSFGRQRKIILGCVAALAVFLQFTPLVPNLFEKNALYAGFVFVFWTAYAITGGMTFKGVKILDNKFARILGEFSMEIYLCHMVVFRVIEKCDIGRFVKNAHVLYWASCCLGIILSISFSYVVTKVIFPRCVKVFKRTFNDC